MACWPTWASAPTSWTTPERGLSFQHGGPLDMRLDPDERRAGRRPARRLNERDLADLIYQYGEERLSRRIARKIVEARRQRADSRRRSSWRSWCGAACRGHRARASGKRRIDPATRTSSRRCGSRSTTSWARWTGLLAALPRLREAGRPGGDHQLPLAGGPAGEAGVPRAGRGRPLTKKPVAGRRGRSAARNPRARSAKLRVARDEPVSDVYKPVSDASEKRGFDLKDEDPDMTRETKVGMAVSASFLCLVGGVLAVKYIRNATQDPPKTAEMLKAEEQAQQPPAIELPPGFPADKLTGDRKDPPPPPPAPDTLQPTKPAPVPPAPVDTLPFGPPDFGPPTGKPKPPPAPKDDPAKDDTFGPLLPVPGTTRQPVRPVRHDEPMLSPPGAIPGPPPLDLPKPADAGRPLDLKPIDLPKPAESPKPLDLPKADDKMDLIPPPPPLPTRGGAKLTYPTDIKPVGAREDKPGDLKLPAPPPPPMTDKSCAPRPRSAQARRQARGLAQAWRQASGPAQADDRQAAAADPRRPAAAAQARRLAQADGRQALDR